MTSRNDQADTSLNTEFHYTSFDGRVRPQSASVVFPGIPLPVYVDSMRMFLGQGRRFKPGMAGVPPVMPSARGEGAVQAGREWHELDAVLVTARTPTTTLTFEKFVHNLEKAASLGWNPDATAPGRNQPIEQKEKKTMSMTIARLAKDRSKEAFHRQGRKALAALADQLGLEKGSYDVRSCKGGPAVLGEVVLHTDHVYVQVNSRDILLRTCEGRKDYTGGHNNFLPLESLENIPSLAGRVQGLVERHAAANTAFHWSHGDDAGGRSHCGAVFAGVATPGQIQRLEAAFIKDERGRCSFIPDMVGLRNMDIENPGGHAPNQFEKMGRTAQKPSDPRSFAEFVYVMERAAAQGWEPSPAAPEAAPGN
jgi:hypothetical protein